MKILALGMILATVASFPIHAQTTRPPVYGEFGVGFGQTLFFGDIRTKLQQSIGAEAFRPNSGANTIVAFYVAPERWRGLGIGARAKVFAAGGSTGSNGDEYFFNYYHVGISAKYYPFTRTFNRGIYIRGSFGPGQLTTKRANDATRTYEHQFAVGSTALIGAGYSIPLGRRSLSVEAEFENATRNGTINGVGEGQRFRSGQLGFNTYITF